jgi:hypothetical protein
MKAELFVVDHEGRAVVVAQFQAGAGHPQGDLLEVAHAHHW